MLRALLGAGWVLLAGFAAASQPARTASDPETPETVRAEIERLRVPNVAWRGIQWKSCLLDGLKEAREKRKPLLLWVFIDRPADDQRC